ncbi:RNA polymerase sigma factor [Adhaeretor mobilis]|uniref:RNA polymerase sigma factor SigX n=1 Tax=Adhaeretor mobilis TaxID=1930276 RepID=A0A517MQG1_9BACT|nr:RNA polymerase sigma factor [Adhaeretor mobilis]QDS97119.1 RNA polymerase sigma factor SigX [Adhaeretor mobilis]
MKLANQQWIARLREEGPQCDAALAELRQLLLRRLQNTFRARPDLTGNFAEDMAQEALLKILKSLDTFEGRSQFTTWATTIAIRTAYSELRKRQWKDVSLEQVVADAGSLEPTSEDQALPEFESDRAELVDAMHDAIRNDLTAKQQEVLLAELAGVPLEEIARRTDSNRNAIYKLTHDARKRLKRSLEERGFSAEDWQAART